MPQPETTYLNGGAAYYRVYTTRDGRHVMLGAVEPKFWRAFCEIAAQPDWIGRQQERLPQTALIQDLAAIFRDAFDGRLRGTLRTRRTAVSARCSIWTKRCDTPHHARRGLVRRGAQGGLQALFPALIDAEPPALRPPLTETGVMRWGCESNPE